MLEERSLAVEIKKGDKQALNTLVQANLKFVVAVCRNYADRGLPLCDLINEGNLGLIRAAHRFDSTFNFKFISYAVWWIRQGILTALAEQSRSWTLSANSISHVRALNVAARKLEQTLERAPTTEELAAETGKSAETIMQCRMASAMPVSLSQPLGWEGGGDAGENLEDRNSGKTDDAASEHLVGKEVSGILASLGERERTVIRLYYGIGYGAENNLAEIGTRMDLSRERIRQIRDKAMQSLRRAAKRRTTTPAFRQAELS